MWGGGPSLAWLLTQSRLPFLSWEGSLQEGALKRIEFLPNINNQRKPKHAPGLEAAVSKGDMVAGGWWWGCEGEDDAGI